ncbi:MAG: hypothetical protein AB7J40_05250 [Candidatus Altimarinota bacterium]
MRITWIVTMVFAVILLGVVPGTAFAQESSSATVSSETEVKQMWHKAPKGLVSTKGTQELEGPIDGKIELKYSFETFKNLERPNGRSGYADRQIYTGEGELSFVLNPDGAKSGGNPYRLGVSGLFEEAQGRYSHGIDLFNYTRTGGQAFLDIRSSEAISGALSYHLRIGAGAIYLEHGKISSVQGYFSLNAEIGYRLGSNWGLIAGFESDLQLGEHSSAWLDGELSAGIQVVTENVTLDFRGLLSAYDRDSNTVTGNFQKVEHERLHPGVQAKLLLFGSISVYARYTWGRDRFKIDTPTRSFSDDSYGESFEGGIALYF